MGRLSQAPSERGLPNCAELVQTRSSESHSSFTSQSSFSIRSLFCCIVDFKLACSFASADANVNWIDAHLMWLLRRLLGPVRHTFLKPLNDKNLKVCVDHMIVTWLHDLIHKSPEHTSKSVKSQNSLEPCPQKPLAQSTLWPHLMYLPRAPPILSVALTTVAVKKSLCLVFKLRLFYSVHWSITHFITVSCPFF